MEGRGNNYNRHSPSSGHFSSSSSSSYASPVMPTSSYPTSRGMPPSNRHSSQYQNQIYNGGYMTNSSNMDYGKNTMNGGSGSDISTPGYSSGRTGNTSSNHQTYIDDQGYLTAGGYPINTNRSSSGSPYSSSGHSGVNFDSDSGNVYTSAKKGKEREKDNYSYKSSTTVSNTRPVSGSSNNRMTSIDPGQRHGSSSSGSSGTTGQKRKSSSTTSNRGASGQGNGNGNGNGRHGPAIGPVRGSGLVTGVFIRY